RSRRRASWVRTSSSRSATRTPLTVMAASVLLVTALPHLEPHWGITHDCRMSGDGGRRLPRRADFVSADAERRCLPNHCDCKCFPGPPVLLLCQDPCDERLEIGVGHGVGGHRNRAPDAGAPTLDLLLEFRGRSSVARILGGHLLVAGAHKLLVHGMASLAV